MKKIILTLVLVGFASFARAGEPSAAMRKTLTEWGIIYENSATIALDGKPAKVWVFLVRTANQSVIPFMTEDGASLAQIKSGYLTACSVVFLYEQLANQKATPSPSPTPKPGLKMKI